MNPKMKSAIEKITLNDATFSNEVIEPTYVNFFYGKNGAGKSTIARTFKANDERLQWQAGKASTDYDVLVYDTDFINANFQNNQALYDEIITTLKAVTSEQVYNSPTEFMPVLTKALASATSDKKLLDKIANGLSIMDKNAEIQRDRKGRIIYDKETKDTELVKWEESIEDYMAREVLPHIPDAAAFFEEDLGKKKPVIKTGAEIPFTRYFYKYQASTPSEELETKFMELEFSVSKRVAKLFE